MGFFMLATASSEAPAQTVSTGIATSAQTAPFDVKAAVKQVLPATATNSAYQTATAAPSGTPLQSATVTALYSTKPAATVTVALPPANTTAVLADGTKVAAVPAAAASQAAPAIAREAAWLYRNGWPLQSLVGRYGVGAPLDEQAHCIAVAVYHEARGESLEGQLAVARVIMNRAASGKYPGSWCGVVKQPWQFSFVSPRTGHYPSVDTGSAAWEKALGITRLATNNAVPSLANDVLWYHADYVAPSWGRRLSFVQKIGTHIFYRS
jgi:spore germination cell wall hydrolase CwlJ-like protein